jgi:hypothetical protein
MGIIAMWRCGTKCLTKYIVRELQRDTVVESAQWAMGIPSDGTQWHRWDAIVSIIN